MIVVPSLTAMASVAVAPGATDVTSIRILSDGSVEPSDAPISHQGNVYTLTDDISSDENGLIIERSDIVIDGANHTLTANIEGWYGVAFTNLSDVRVRYLEIQDYDRGFMISSSSSVTIEGCSISGTNEGLFFEGNNTKVNITGNHIASNYGSAIETLVSSDFTIEGNELAWSSHGIGFMDSARNCTVRGNEIHNNSLYGIFFYGDAMHCIIEENRVLDNYNGIVIYNHNDTKLLNNTVSSNERTGVESSGSNGFVILGNTIGGNGYGVSVEDHLGSRIVGNSIGTDQVVGLYSSKASSLLFSGNTLASNGDGAHLHDTRDSVVSENEFEDNLYDGLYIDSAINISVQGNQMSGNDVEGLSLLYVTLSNITGNVITFNEGSGIYAESSSHNVLTRNKVFENTAYGLYMWEFHSNVLKLNDIRENHIAGIDMLFTYYSVQNLLYHNLFGSKDNINFTSPDMPNTWDLGYPTGGNLWAGEGGTDTASGPGQDLPGSDSINDEAIEIDPVNVDRYPLAPVIAPGDMYITPDRGGTSGQVTVKIYGVVEDVASAKLHKDGSDISSSKVWKGLGINYALFDLRGKSTGLYDLQLTMTNGRQTTLPACFTVGAGGYPELVGEVIGRSEIRMGTTENFYFRITNKGTVDTGMGVFRVSVDVPFEFTRISQVVEGLPFQFFGESNMVETTLQTQEFVLMDASVFGNFRMADFIFTNIPSGGSILIKAAVYCPPGSMDSEMSKTPSLHLAPLGVLGKIIQLGIGVGKEVAEEWLQNYVDSVCHETIEGYTGSNRNEVTAQMDAYIETLSYIQTCFGIATCAAAVVMVLMGLTISPAIAAGFLLVDMIWTIAIEIWMTIKAIFSLDPNDKVGPPGFGEQGFVPFLDSLTYTINFENLANATASAQRIVITDQLDSDLDWGTLTFGMTSHPAFVNASFDEATGIITWIFDGIELPPNVHPPEGQGWVMFTIDAKNDLPSGTVVRNKASIVFDFNEAIETNEVVHTIDAVSPNSSVSSMSSEQPLEFKVTWSGSDGQGSGIASYDVYVSKDGGVFQLWRSNDTNTSATYTGEDGHTYGFFSVATDNVGNMEGYSGVADVTVTAKKAQPFDWTLVAIVLAVVAVAAVGAFLLLRRRH